jgi:hypothetical protein
METLDTVEATYIWHIAKNVLILKNKLIETDLEISMVRNKGGQVFLESQPQSFTRYSNERKGFVIWKD